MKHYFKCENEKCGFEWKSDGDFDKCPLCKKQELIKDYGSREFGLKLNDEESEGGVLDLE